MLRPKTSVARRATDTIHARAGRLRAGNQHTRVEFHEILRPSDLGLGQLFTLSREAAVVGNVETGRIALWNPAAERLFGWSVEEAVGQPIELLIPASIVRLHQAGLDLYLRTGRGNFMESHRPFEVPAVTMRGEEIHVELSLAPVDYPSRPGRYVLALMRDVSDRRRAEMQGHEVARAESAREQAERTVTRHGRLVQDGVTDLGRELRRLRRSTQRLKRSVGMAPQARRVELRTRVVEARAERVQRELEMFATSTAIETSTLELQLERVNLVPLVSQVVARLRARGTAHKLNVALPQGLTALVDLERIELAVQALLEHTLARCPRGGWVDVDLRRPLVGLARLEIRDYGRTVSEEARQRLLDAVGTDRNLALVRSIVNLHGGTFEFEFPADGGVRAVVTLPTQRGRVLANAAG